MGGLWGKVQSIFKFYNELAMNIIKKILSHNWFAIIYFNFKMLPFKQAIKLPFDFYYKTKFEDLSGRVILISNNIYRGMVKIGSQGSDMFSHNTNILMIKGEVIFRGKCTLGIGCLLRAEKDAKIELGNNLNIGSNIMIFSEDKIIFRNDVLISWNCQIMDTDTHPTINIKEGKILPHKKAITIVTFKK